MLRLLRRSIVVAAVAGALYAIWQLLAARRTAAPRVAWEAAPVPSPPRPVPAVEPTSEAPPDAEAPPTWVEPEGAGCPTTHPVKAKLGSGIFHVPGGVSYERTRPDRCYLDPAAAESDGLRAAKR